MRVFRGPLFDPRPLVGDPALNGLVVAFPGPPLGPLHAPAQPLVQQPPHRPCRQAHPGQPLNDHGDAVKGPQVVVESGRLGALEQGLLDSGQLGVSELGVGASPAAASEPVNPAGLPSGVPAACALTGHPQLAGDLSLGASLGEQLGRAHAPGLARGAVFIGRRAADGRHPPISP